MKEEQYRLLQLAGQLPARLTAEQTASLLNCQVHDVVILMASRLLKPLGNPPRTGVKFFAAVEILELSRDRVWLARMSNALYKYWQVRNARKHQVGGGNGETGGNEEGEYSAKSKQSFGIEL